MNPLRIRTLATPCDAGSTGALSTTNKLSALSWSGGRAVGAAGLHVHVFRRSELVLFQGYDARSSDRRRSLTGNLVVEQDRTASPRLGAESIGPASRRIEQAPRMVFSASAGTERGADNAHARLDEKLQASTPVSNDF